MEEGPSRVTPVATIESPPTWFGAVPRPRWAVALSKIEEILGAALIVIILGLLLIQVGQRYLPVPTQAWVGELSRYALMALTFLLVGSLMGQGKHVSIDAILNVGGDRHRRIVVVVSSIIAAMCSAVFAYDSFSLVASDNGQTLQITGIPMRWLYFIPLVAFCSATIQALLNIVYAPHENDATESTKEAS